MKAKSIVRILMVALFAVASIQVYKLAHAHAKGETVMLACGECGV